MAVTYTSRKTNMISSKRKSVIMVISTGATDVAVDTGLTNVQFCTVHGRNSADNQCSIARNSKVKATDAAGSSSSGGWVYLGDCANAVYRLYAEGW